jgi:hypothetical protein
MSKFIKFDDGTSVLGNGTATAVSLDNPNTDLRNPGERKTGEILEFMNEYREKPRNAASAVPLPFFGTISATRGVSNSNGGFWGAGSGAEDTILSIGSQQAIRLNNVTAINFNFSVGLTPITSMIDISTLPSSDFTIPYYVTFGFIDYTKINGLDPDFLVVLFNEKIDNLQGDTTGKLRVPQEGFSYDLTDTIVSRDQDSSGNLDFNDTNDFNVRNKITEAALKDLLFANDKLIWFNICFDDSSLSGDNATYMSNNLNNWGFKFAANFVFFGLLSSYAPVSN